MTIRTYDISAQALAEYFRGIGSREEDIFRGFEMVDRFPPHVVEIGCGDGRDAESILANTPYYLGMDISDGMLQLARKLNPGGRFIWGDIASFDVPLDTDIVFSFASLLHVPKEDVEDFFNRAHGALNTDGIIYISTKQKPEYSWEVQKDRFGERLFYYYTPELIEKLAEGKYKKEYFDSQTIGSTEWFTIALRKQ